MTYEQTIKSINYFLKSPEARQILGGKTEIFDHVLGMIDNHVTEMNKNDNIIISANEEEINKVRESIDMIKNILMEVPITKNIKNFVTDYSTLLLNWVNNCVKTTTTIPKEIDFIQRFIEYHFSSVEILKIIPEMLQKLHHFRQIGLPVVSLSRHYLETLDNINKGG